MIKDKIRTVPDWPKKGIMFRDITTLLRDPEGFGEMNEQFYRQYRGMQVDFVVGIEARGFIMGAVLADRLGVGFVPARKKDKLPPEVVGQAYKLEYGTDHIEMNRKALGRGARVVLVDDLIATGGTAIAACRLIEKLGGTVLEVACVVDLPDLGGSRRLAELGYKIFHLTEFEGD